VDWRAAMKRSLRRAGEIGGALVLLSAMVFLALALVSYHQTDPSASTAAGGPVLNWMGTPGAWAAERALFLFGPVRAAAAAALRDGAQAVAAGRGRRPGTAAHRPRLVAPDRRAAAGDGAAGHAARAVDRSPGGSLPAGDGRDDRAAGRQGARCARRLLPEAAQGWAKLAAGLACLAGGALLAGRVFALDWGGLFTLPGLLRRRAPAAGTRVSCPPPAPREKKQREAAGSPLQPLGPDRKAPEISDPARMAKPAQLTAASRQGDLFDKFELPGLDLLHDPPPNSAPKIDKLALERNARLLETVLDDFNVKGEITAVRTGPVVTMYELEPAPGIKASRVIGLADDIARNMSAISARVSAIPGRTVMGIELPNADRQMVSFKELVACEKFAGSKGALPIILGKDIAGEPIVADLATMPHLLVAGTTGSGKSVGLNCILLSLLYRLTPAQCRMILVDPKVLELKSYDDIPHLLSPRGDRAGQGRARAEVGG
jgi:S-DNA-T family DNA segregation ATPase FtsK/SpoIIIE